MAYRYDNRLVAGMGKVARSGIDVEVSSVTTPCRVRDKSSVRLYDGLFISLPRLRDVADRRTKRPGHVLRAKRSWWEVWRPHPEEPAVVAVRKIEGKDAIENKFQEDRTSPLAVVDRRAAEEVGLSQY